MATVQMFRQDARRGKAPFELWTLEIKKKCEANILVKKKCRQAGAFVLQVFCVGAGLCAGAPFFSPPPRDSEADEKLRDAGTYCHSPPRPPLANTQNGA